MTRLTAWPLMSRPRIASAACLERLVRGLRDLDAAGLAAAADLHLRLDDDRRRRSSRPPPSPPRGCRRRCPAARARRRTRRGPWPGTRKDPRCSSFRIASCDRHRFPGRALHIEGRSTSRQRPRASLAPARRNPGAAEDAAVGVQPGGRCRSLWTARVSVVAGIVWRLARSGRDDRRTPRPRHAPDRDARRPHSASPTPPTGSSAGRAPPRPESRHRRRARAGATRSASCRPDSASRAIYQVAGPRLDGLDRRRLAAVALQDDQVAGLVEHPDAPRAVDVNSATTTTRTTPSWRRVAAGEVSYVFLAPEQLARTRRVERLARRRGRAGRRRRGALRLVVGPRLPTRTTWRLGEVAERLGRPPVLALTATGSAPVRDEIVERLRLRDPLVLAAGSTVPSLWLARASATRTRPRSAGPSSSRSPSSTDAGHRLRRHPRRERREYADEIAERAPTASSRPYHAGLRWPSAGPCTSGSTTATSTWSSRRAPSAWASTSPTSASSCTPTSPSRSTPTTRRSGGPVVTASRPTRPCTTGPRTWPALVLRVRLAARPPGPRPFRRRPGDRPDRPLARWRRRPACRPAPPVVPLNALLDAGALRDDVDGVSRAPDGPTTATRCGRARQPTAPRTGTGRGVAHRDDARARRDARLPPPVPARLLRRRAAGAVRQLRHLLVRARPARPPRTSADGANDEAWPPDARVEHAEWGTGVVMSTEEDRHRRCSSSPPATAPSHSPTSSNATCSNASERTGTTQAVSAPPGRPGRGRRGRSTTRRRPRSTPPSIGDAAVAV